MAGFSTLAGAGMAFTLTLAPLAHGAGWEMAGTKSIVVTTREGQRMPIGSVHFSPAPDGTVAFKVSMDPQRLTDHFLSMREFKCLDGSTEVVCHVPYPHPQPGVVTPANLAWLEHSLLFFYKQPQDFGAKLWNGIYFQLQPGEASLVGTPQAIDLNLIGAPPLDPGAPPYVPALRDAMPLEKRWIQSLSIE